MGVDGLKKLIIGCISLAVLLIVSGYVYFKYSTPLVAIPSGYSTDKQVLLVEVGNKNIFGEIEIKDVLINNNNKPSEVKIQVSNPYKGFIITDNFSSDEENTYTFKDLNEVKLEPKTDPQKQLDKVNDGTATKDDQLYAITLGHQESIDKVIINYNYLGITFNKTVLINELIDG